MKRIGFAKVCGLLFLLAGEVAYGNNKLNLLMDPVWQLHSRNEREWVKMRTFDHCMMRTIVQYKGESQEGCYRYYLSDRPEERFDESRVGQDTGGDYLIFEVCPGANGSTGKPGVYEIVQLDKTVLKLKIAGDSRVTTYIRTKEKKKTEHLSYFDNVEK